MSPLFAQAAVTDPTGGSPGLLALLGTALAGAAAFFAAVLMLVIVRNGQRRFELEHAERMRAVEAGLPVAPRPAAWPRAFVCVAIGVGVPAIAFLFTYLAYDRPGAPDELWVAPPILGALSVVAASVLAGVLFPTPPGSAAEGRGAGAEAPGLAVKGPHDPDALDVVGRRG